MNAMSDSEWESFKIGYKRAIDARVAYGNIDPELAARQEYVSVMEFCYAATLEMTRGVNESYARKWRKDDREELKRARQALDEYENNR